MTDLCSICEHDVTNETAYFCHECWHNDLLELLCRTCADTHSSTDRIGKKHIILKSE